MKTLRDALLLAFASLSLHCGSDETPNDAPPCTGLDVRLVDVATAPPANVAALVDVTDCGGNALGVVLHETSFHLLEDDESIPKDEAPSIVTPAKRQAEQRTLIALDRSGSVVRSGLAEEMVDAALRLATSLAAPDHEVALFGFDGRADLIRFTNFTSDATRLEAASEAAKNSELVDASTNLNGAIVGALAILDRGVEIAMRDSDTIAQGTLVVFTDGVDRADRVDANVARTALERTKHSVFAIGVGRDIDDAAIGTIGRTRAFHAYDAAEIDLAFYDVEKMLEARSRTRYVVSHCSPARAHERTLEITVRLGALVGSVAFPFRADGFGAGCSPLDTLLE